MTQRGYLGTMTLPSSLDDELHLDFVESMRGFAMQRLGPAAESAFRAAESVLPVSAELPDGRSQDLDEGIEIARRSPEVGLRNGFLRQCQEMLWRRTVVTYSARRTELMAELADYDRRGPGRLVLDPPGFKMPEYLCDYHLQPGGYHTDPLAGYVYHYGTKIFWVGANDHDQQKEQIIQELALPDNFSPQVVVDLGCSVGQSTTALKGRFPEAEVWGVDVATPLLRYAHMRSARAGIEVNFAQEDAASLHFDDGSVDLIYASILFHEVPVGDGQRVITEVHRALRPGGIFVISDMRPFSPNDDRWRRYDRYFDTIFNEEKWEYSYLSSDFESTLATTFATVGAPPEPTMMRRWTAVKAA